MKPKAGGQIFAKGCLHCHTTLSDGNLSPRDLIEEYKQRGYHFVAITDHRNKPKPYDYPTDDGILVLKGVEVSSGHHWNYIEGDKETLTIWNHPFRYEDSIRDINRCGKDAVEITEHGDFCYNADTPSSKIIEQTKLPTVVTDDAHSKHMIGHSWIWVRVSELTKDEIIKNIKEGSFSIEKKEL